MEKEKSTGERLATIEANQNALMTKMVEFIGAQKEHNDRFYEMRDAMLKAKGAWWTIGIFGTLTMAVSGLVAFVVTHVRLKILGQ